MPGTDPDAVHMQIGAAAARTELSVNTIRHWDEAGLVSPSARSAGGFRLYTESDIERLLLIRRMKPLGFTLDEMGQLLTSLDSLRTGPDPSASAFVADCHTRARQSCETLRVQLSYAEELTELLGTRQ